jgi:hypothetical protein
MRLSSAANRLTVVYVESKNVIVHSLEEEQVILLQK